MAKILKRKQFNNGYGCQCCRRDWEETEWIDESEMPTIRDFFENELIKFDQNCADGGCVGITYEKDGLVLFGVEADIYKAEWYFNAIQEDDDAYLTKRIPEVSRKNYRDVVFDLQTVWDFYGIDESKEEFVDV